MFITAAKTSGKKDGKEFALKCVKDDADVIGILATAEFGRPINYTTSGAKTVKSTPGVIKSVMVNADLTGTVTIANDTTTIAVLPIGITAGTLYRFDAFCDTNITVTLSAADDITVIYI